MNKALALPFGIFNNDNSPVDGKYMFWDTTVTPNVYRPYNGTAEVLTALPTGVRYKGLVVRVLTDSEVGTEKEYSFANGITDGDLVEKGVATALPAQIQTANFQNTTKILQRVANMCNADIANQLFDTSGIGSTFINFLTESLNVTDMMPEDALFDAETWDTVSPVYWFVSTSTGGIHKLDMGFIEPAVTYYSGTFGTVFTGDNFGSGNVRKMFIDKVNRKLYFITSENNAFYILDYVNNVLDKRTYTTQGTPTNIIPYVSANKVIIINAAGTITLFNLADDTIVNYNRTSGNYTGDLLPSSNPYAIAQAALVGNVLWLGASSGLTPSQNRGLWKLDLSTLVSTRVLNEVGYTGGLAPCGPYGFYRNATNFCRIEFATGTVKAYTYNVNYTGNGAISTTAFGFRWDERTNSVLMLSSSGVITIAVFDIAAETAKVYFGLIPETSGVTVGNYTPMVLIPDYFGAYPGTIAVRRTSGSEGIPFFLQMESGNSMARVTYDQYGLKVDITADTNRDFLSPYNVIHKKYVDEMKAKLDLVGISQHAVAPDSVTSPGNYIFLLGSDFSNAWYQDPVVLLNGEESDFGGGIAYIDITLSYIKPKMEVYFLCIGASSIVFTGILDGFDPMTFILKDSSGVEWDGLTQTFTPPADGKLYKFTFTKPWEGTKVFVEWEVFPWTY